MNDLDCLINRGWGGGWPRLKVDSVINNNRFPLNQQHYCWLLTLKVLNFWKFTSYCSLKPLWSGMGEVVPARTSPALHAPSPPTEQNVLNGLSAINRYRVTFEIVQKAKNGMLSICSTSWSKFLWTADQAVLNERSSQRNTHCAKKTLSTR